MPEELNTVRQALLTGDDLPDKDKMIQQMRDEARRLTKSEDDAAKAKANMAQRIAAANAAMVSNGGGGIGSGGFSGGPGGGKGGGSTRKCKWCSKNHAKDGCYTKYPEKAPDWYKQMLERKKKNREEEGNLADVGPSNKASSSWGDAPFYLLCANMFVALCRWVVNCCRKQQPAEVKKLIRLPPVQKGSETQWITLEKREIVSCDRTCRFKRRWKGITVNYKTPDYTMGAAAGILIALPVMKVLSILKLLPKSIDRRWFPKKKKRTRHFNMPSSDNMFGNWLWKLLWMCYFVSTWALFALLIWNWNIGTKCGDSALGSNLPGPKSLISMVDWSKLFTNGAAPPTVSNNTYHVYEATYSHKMASSLVNTVCEHWSGGVNIQCGDSILDSILPGPTHLTTSVNRSELFINGAVLCAVSVCQLLIRMTYSHPSKARIIELGNHVAFMASGDTTNQDTTKPRWCYDSGASIHLSGDRKSFVSFHELPHQDRVPIRLAGDP
ncbi:hypothetical protein BDR26DRAFT_902281 [Obelidium mucronatum]|nr:hypothetical protein BDR26DRAFT_902281 [Obelidium mucronatum]